MCLLYNARSRLEEAYVGSRRNACIPVRPAGRSSAFGFGFSAFGAEGRSRNFPKVSAFSRTTEPVCTYGSGVEGEEIHIVQYVGNVRRAVRLRSASAFCERPTENRHFEKGRSRTKKKLRPAALIALIPVHFKG